VPTQGTNSITPSGTDGNPWFDFQVTDTIEPDYVGVSVVAPVPLPAAGWLLLASVGVLTGLGRRKIA